MLYSHQVTMDTTQNPQWFTIEKKVKCSKGNREGRKKNKGREPKEKPNETINTEENNRYC